MEYAAGGGGEKEETRRRDCTRPLGGENERHQQKEEEGKPELFLRAFLRNILPSHFTLPSSGSLDTPESPLLRPTSIFTILACVSFILIVSPFSEHILLLHQVT